MNAALLLISAGVLSVCGVILMIRGLRDEQADRRKGHPHSSPH